MYLQKVISRKNCVKNYFFAGILKVNDENSRIRIRIRIHKLEVWIRGSGSGSTPKLHGSGTLITRYLLTHILCCCMITRYMFISMLCCSMITRYLLTHMLCCSMITRYLFTNMLCCSMIKTEMDPWQHLETDLVVLLHDHQISVDSYVVL
jgi:hypothetical protein